MHSTEVVYLFLTQRPLVRFPAFQNFFQSKMINVTEVNKRRRLAESWQWLENVDLTHLVQKVWSGSGWIWIRVNCVIRWQKATSAKSLGTIRVVFISSWFLARLNRQRWPASRCGFGGIPIIEGYRYYHNGYGVINYEHSMSYLCWLTLL